MISLLLASGILFANPTFAPRLTPRQVRQQANQIISYLRKTDPRVLREVTNRTCRNHRPARKNAKQRAKEDLDTFDRWHLNLLLDQAGIPRKRD